jgi:hypothetical protein
MIRRAQTIESYRADYTWGWRYSARPTATLDHLDSINATDAAYDGYMDRACNREKWHFLYCPEDWHDACDVIAVADRTLPPHHAYLKGE